MTKSRFCPSPTGRMHMGNVRTALFNALLAKHDRGTFLLRIEDTDADRSEEAYVEGIQEDLAWLGMHWQEGLAIGGDHGPYFQSERHDIYRKYYQKLVDESFAYPCFCTPEELEQSRKMQRRRGIAPRYAGTCRHLSAEDIEKRRAQGIPETLRFKMPVGKTITFEDTVRGKQSFASDDIGDFIIRRADGGATFMFCNAIDDALMGVTFALRGEDHLTNTPRQLILSEVLGLQAPQYGHISLIVGPDGTPLSKRHGSKSIAELREVGFLPVALVNYLARLGHSYVDQNQLMSYDDCAKYFDLTHLVKSAAKYDEAQLLYWQKEAVLALSESGLLAWLGRDLLSELSDEMASVFARTIQPNILFPSEAIDWKKRLFGEIVYDDSARDVLHQAGKIYFTALLHLLENTMDYVEIIAGLKAALGVKGKALFMPFRVLMTGVLHGPEMAALLQLVGKERLIQRTQQILMENFS